MAVKWVDDSQVCRTAHGYSVLPENVVILPELSGRMTATDVEELAADIETNGQLENAVCWKNEAGWPVLAAGHRRYRAILTLNAKRLPDNHIRLQFSYVDAKNEQEAFDYTVRENRNRINPSPLDDASNMHTYQTRFGLGIEGIALKYFPGVSGEAMEKAIRDVKNTLALLELSPEAQEELRKGFMGTSAALQLAAIPSRKKQNEVIQEAKDKGAKKLKVSDAKAAKEEVNGAPKPRKSISESTPVKLLEKFKIIAELAGALAVEALASKKPDHEVVQDLGGSIILACKKYSVPLLPEGEKWAEKNKDLQLPNGL